MTYQSFHGLSQTGLAWNSGPSAWLNTWDSTSQSGVTPGFGRPTETKKWWVGNVKHPNTIFLFNCKELCERVDAAPNLSIFFINPGR